MPEKSVTIMDVASLRAAARPDRALLGAQTSRLSTDPPPSAPIAVSARELSTGSGVL
jgi:hypothetical protein